MSEKLSILINILYNYRSLAVSSPRRKFRGYVPLPGMLSVKKCTGDDAYTLSSSRMQSKDRSHHLTNHKYASANKSVRKSDCDLNKAKITNVVTCKHECPRNNYMSAAVTRAQPAKGINQYARRARRAKSNTSDIPIPGRSRTSVIQKATDPRATGPRRLGRTSCPKFRQSCCSPEAEVLRRSHRADTKSNIIKNPDSTDASTMRSQPRGSCDHEDPIEKASATKLCTEGSRQVNHSSRFIASSDVKCVKSTSKQHDVSSKPCNSTSKLLNALSENDDTASTSATSTHCSSCIGYCIEGSRHIRKPNQIENIPKPENTTNSMLSDVNRCNEKKNANSKEDNQTNRRYPIKSDSNVATNITR